MSYYKRKKFIKNSYKNCDLKTSPRLFCVCKEFGKHLLENGFFEASCLYQICNSKTIKTCPNQLADLLRFLFT